MSACGGQVASYNVAAEILGGDNIVHPKLACVQRSPGGLGQSQLPARRGRGGACGDRSCCVRHSLLSNEVKALEERDLTYFRLVLAGPAWRGGIWLVLSKRRCSPDDTATV